MQLFFEEDGSFKAGTILKQEGNAYQVELPSGKRTKVKGGHVFFSFESPGAAALIESAQKSAAELDPGFLWEVAPEEEFGYEDLAADYFTTPNAVEKAAMMFALHGNPVYFYRKGRGRYRKAPEDILKRALEAVEKKRRLEERRAEMARMMVAGELPEEIARAPFALLLHPDKNAIDWKALNDAAAETRQTPLRLLMKLGAIKSPYEWHVRSFYEENFPRGSGFPAALPLPAGEDCQYSLAQVHAFSIDDSSTTEIDDASSVTFLDETRARIGIHIAAPGLLMPRDCEVDRVARSRMSTVYAPGLKTTMLPETWVGAASLDAGRPGPCVSLYVTVDRETLGILSTETRVERIALEANLRHDRFGIDITEENIMDDALQIPYRDEIRFLWRFAKARQAEREQVRGRPEVKGRIDWFFELEGEGEQAKVHLKGRARGEPIDLLIAELMIFANSTWGLWLEEHGTAGIYRSQRMGRVRMSTSPGPHDGLGVPRYAWSTSPLRRYVDLVNQRQILATALGVQPPYQRNDSDFFAIVSQFEATYDTYLEFQRKMERYWSLRWIEQEGLRETRATVVKEDLVRIEGLPLMQRIPGLPQMERGQKIVLSILGCDYIELFLETRLKEVLHETEILAESDIIEEEESQGEPVDAAASPEQGEIGGNAPEQSAPAD
jgi:exoribonuclease-2